MGAHEKRAEEVVSVLLPESSTTRVVVPAEEAGSLMSTPLRKAPHPALRAALSRQGRGLNRGRVITFNFGSSLQYIWPPSAGEGGMRGIPGEGVFHVVSS
jgi:hypothetical protein